MTKADWRCPACDEVMPIDFDGPTLQGGFPVDMMEHLGKHFALTSSTLEAIKLAKSSFKIRRKRKSVF